MAEYDALGKDKSNDSVQGLVLTVMSDADEIVTVLPTIGRTPVGTINANERAWMAWRTRPRVRGLGVGRRYWW